MLLARGKLHNRRCYIPWKKKKKLVLSWIFFSEFFFSLKSYLFLRGKEMKSKGKKKNLVNMLLAAALHESDRDALAGWSGEKHVASILFRRGAGTSFGRSGHLLFPPGLSHQPATYGQEGLVELSREDWERRRVRGPMLESASEEVGKSLYQPATALERSSSSKMIWAIPMKHLWSMRP